MPSSEVSGLKGSLQGIDALLDACPQVKVGVDAGYQGLAKEHLGQVSAPLRWSRDSRTDIHGCHSADA
jgi:hypothetical protein